MPDPDEVAAAMGEAPDAEALAAVLDDDGGDDYREDDLPETGMGPKP